MSGFQARSQRSLNLHSFPPASRSGRNTLGQELWPDSSPSYPKKEVIFLSDAAFQSCRTLTSFHSIAMSTVAQGPVQCVVTAETAIHGSTAWVEGPRCQLAPYRALSLQSSSQDILQELFKGPGHSIYQVRVQVHQDPNTVPSWSEVRAGPQRAPHPAL